MNFATHLETNRISLSPLTLGDFWSFYNLLGSEDVRRYLGGPVKPKDRAYQFLHHLAVDPHVGIWAVRQKARRRAIGLIELGPHKDGQDFEVSYQFHPNSWGYGFAREAVAAVVQHGLSLAELKRIIAETQRDNAASRRLLENLGMREMKRVQRYGEEQIIYTTI